MEKFIPYEKLSKKAKRELDARRRGTWGGLNPVTRKPANPKAYDRNKAKRWKYDDSHSSPCVILCGSSPCRVGILLTGESSDCIVQSN